MKFRNLLVLLFAALLVAACNDDENIVGGSIRPSKDDIHVSYDASVPISAYSFKSNAFRTDLGIKGYDYYMLGGFSDDIDETAGIRGHIALQFWSSSLDHIKPNSDSVIVVDTVKLILLYDRFYGDSLSVNKLEVYELNTQLSSSEEYYSNENSLDYYSESDLIGELNNFSTIDESVPDSIRWAEGYVHALEIPLKREIGERIFANLDDIRNDVDAFRDLFNGVYIKSVLGSKTIFYISPILDYGDEVLFSTLNVVYHYESTGLVSVVDSFRTENFIINNECAGFNVINSTPGTYNYDTTIVPERLYVHGLGVSNARIKLPSLYNYSAFLPIAGEDSARVAINNAKIVFKIDTAFQSVSNVIPPTQLYLRRDTNGGYTYTNDEFIALSTSSGQTFGGLTSDYTYEFNITEYVQELINNKTEIPNDLVLSVVNNRNNPSLTFLKGLSHTDNLKLEIVYTRY